MTDSNRFARYLDGTLPVEELTDAEANALVACSLGEWVDIDWGLWDWGLQDFDEDWRYSMLSPIDDPQMRLAVLDYSNDWAHAGPLLEAMGPIINLSGNEWMEALRGTNGWRCLGHCFLGIDTRPTRAIVNAHLEKWRLGMETADAKQTTKS